MDPSAAAKEPWLLCLEESHLDPETYQADMHGSSLIRSVGAGVCSDSF